MRARGPSRLSAPEAAALGMRRGRSAYAADDVPADNGVALERQLERQRNREGPAQGSQPPSQAVSSSAEGSGDAEPEGISGATLYGRATKRARSGHRLPRRTPYEHNGPTAHLATNGHHDGVGFPCHCQPLLRYTCSNRQGISGDLAGLLPGDSPRQ